MKNTKKSSTNLVMITKARRIIISEIKLDAIIVTITLTSTCVQDIQLQKIVERIENLMMDNRLKRN